MSMNAAESTETKGRRPLAWLYPLLIVFALALVVLQSMPVVVPIGPMNWDVLVYYDAIGRIAQGQLPSVDFFAPVGPLEYLLAAFSAWLFPEAQPVFLTQWIWLPVTVPMMALILWDVARTGRGWLGFWLLAPWMFFTLLPYNAVDFYPYPGTDGFGIYNRHGAQLIYLVAATVLFVRSAAIQTALLSVLLIGLAFCKITAFLAAGPILLFGLVLGRIRLLTAIATALICIGLTGLAELATGMVVPYVQDIIVLASQNSDALLPRFLTAGSVHFNVVGAGGLLALVLLIAALGGNPAARGRSGGNALARMIDADWFWVGLLLLCGLFYETQNTGSQAFIMVWPALLAILMKPRAGYGRYGLAVVALVAFTAVPTVSTMAHKAVRAIAVAPGYVKLDAPDLGPLGLYSTKDVFATRAERIRQIYIDRRDTFEEIAEQGILPAFLLFSDPDYQFLLLDEMQKATAAIKGLEIRSRRRFERVLNLDFANPFPFILKKKGAEFVAIGADPSRAVPELDERTRNAVAQTDLVLAPTCPVHHARRVLLEHYASALTGHERITLTPCFDAYILPANR